MKGKLLELQNEASKLQQLFEENNTANILLCLSTGTYVGFFASFFYLLVYILTNILFFFILLLIRKSSHLALLFFNQFKMIFTTNFCLYILFLFPLFSYAGFPPFLGFFTKFSVVVSLIDTQQIGLTLLLILYIVISAYLYLRIIKLTLFETQNQLVYLQRDKNLLPENDFKIKVSSSRKEDLKLVNKWILIVVFLIVFLISLGICVLPFIFNGFLQPLISLFFYY
jgi:NADH-quinone oxidoreductase subunit N